MAASVSTDFKIYQAEFNGGFNETLQQNTNVFNAASRRAITLVPRRLRGHYEKESFFTALSSLVVRRDTTSVAAVADTALTQDEFIGVKLNRRIGPIGSSLDSLKKGGYDADPSAFSFLLGQQTAVATAKDMVDSILRALRAALVAQSGVYEDDTAATITTAGLVDTLARFGDAADRVVLWVMHSKPYYDLVKGQIAANIDGVSNFNVASASPVTLNRPVLIVDSPALVVVDGVTSGTDAYYSLGLVPMGGEVAESEPPTVVTEVVTGLHQLIVRLQGENAFNLRCKGFKWDIANGGENPTDAAVATGSNWDKAVTSDKLLAGVALGTR